MSVQNSHTLKQLETRRAQLRADCEHKKTVMSDAQRDFQEAAERLKAVERQIEELQRPSASPIVTEHALLRYLERVRGIDLEAVRKEMLTDDVVERITAFKSCRLPVGDGVVLVVEDHVVKTVATAASRTKKPARVKRTGPKPVELRRIAREAHESAEQ